jgi:hypothetical protein
MPAIPALRRLRQEDHWLEASLGFIVSSRPAWGTGQDPLLKNQKLKINK